MKRLGTVLPALLIAASMSVPAFAQGTVVQQESTTVTTHESSTTAQPQQVAPMTVGSAVTGVVQNGNRTIIFERSNTDLDMAQLRAFSRVANDDPAVAAKIARNPQIVADNSYVSRHPALQQFLDQYPNAREDIQRNPGNYVTPVAGSSFQHALPGLRDNGQ